MVGAFLRNRRDGFYEAVQNAGPGTAPFFQNLVNAAVELANELDPDVEHDHATGYGGDNVEFQVWALAALCEAWVLENFSRKVREGHCNLHRIPPVMRPCPGTREMHRTLLKRAGRTFTALARN